MTRSEHLQWCKDRAGEYLDRGDWQQAWNSFASDISKHDETKDHAAITMGMMLMMGGHNQNVPEMRKFIEGCN